MTGIGGNGGSRLLSETIGLAGAGVFAAIAASHLRHLVSTSGQRRAWHGCHVLMAIGMAFMFLPAAADPVAIPSTLWQALFAVAGGLAALWAITATQRAPTSIWLLTAVDLAAMAAMWSSSGLSAPAGWVLAAYFAAQAMLWSLDGYRRIDGGQPLVQWNAFDTESGPALALRADRIGQVATSLLGELDITVSMFAMTAGAAFMCAAMALAH